MDAPAEKDMQFITQNFPPIFLTILPTKFIFYHFEHKIYEFFPLGVTP